MRKKIAVLFGGCSPEYSVSLQSAYAVLTHMDRNQYEPVPVGISPKGEWFLYTGDLDRIPEDRWLHGDPFPWLFSFSRHRSCRVECNTMHPCRFCTGRG